ncbi:MAG: hypothetical protein ACRD2C_16845 [Acidimicrobiales bacterium]
MSSTPSPQAAPRCFHADRPHAYRNDHKRPVQVVMVVLQPDADVDQWTAERARG